MKDDKVITKVCPNCNLEFPCYSQSSQKCWCDNYLVPTENLKLLAEKYNNCLCPDCLGLYGKKKK